MPEGRPLPTVYIQSRVDDHTSTLEGYLAFVRLPFSKLFAPVVTHPTHEPAVTVIDPRVLIRDELGQILFQGPTTEELLDVLFRATVQGWRTSGQLIGESLALE
jgi:hypothetical protein